MSQAQCSHSRVIRILDQTGVGFTSEYWECPGCNTRFHPEPADIHRIRLRDQFATAALIGFLTDIPPLPPEPLSSTEHIALCSYQMADAMLAQRDKKS